MKIRTTAGAFLAGAMVSGALCASLLLPSASAQRGANFQRMNNALTALQNARDALQNSKNAYPGDHFEGHRQDALNLVNQAISEVQWGINVGN